jgi:hypothetical protein
MMYAVVVEGTTLPSFDSAAVRVALAKLIGRTESDADRLLAGTPRTIKSNLDQATGMRYVDALRKIGVACHLKQETLAVDLDESVLPATAPGGTSRTSFIVASTAADESSRKYGVDSKKKAHSRLWLALGVAAILGIAMQAINDRPRATAARATDTVERPHTTSLKPILPVSRTTLSTLGHIKTKRGAVEISGRFAPDSDKVIVIFSPAVSIDDDATSFFQELAELLYGIRPSRSMQEDRAGVNIILGDSPKRFLLLPAKDSNSDKMLGAAISPRQ